MKVRSKTLNSTIATTVKNFASHNIQGHYVAKRDDLLDLLSTLIQPGCTVGCGDSATLEQLGVFDFLRKGEFHFLDKHEPGLTSAEKRELYLQNFRADIFVSGANAITADGKIINIDGNGSRVAPMIYGPNRVVLIVGTNKIADNEEEGMRRARQIAGPMDAKRLGRKTPCAVTGVCTDCSSPERICNDFVVIASQFNLDRIHVIIVGGSYGF
jgi:hypothetical protein